MRLNKKPGLASPSPGRMTHRREEESGEKYETNRSKYTRQLSSLNCNEVFQGRAVATVRNESISSLHRWRGEKPLPENCLRRAHLLLDKSRIQSARGLTQECNSSLPRGRLPAITVEMRFIVLPGAGNWSIREWKVTQSSKVSVSSRSPKRQYWPASNISR